MDSTEIVILLLHTAATWYMAGVIMLVQLVHYPLMRHVPPAGFSLFEQAHVRGMGWVVAPAMLLELVTGVWLCFKTPMGVSALWPVLGLLLLIALWGVTWGYSVPCHRRLEQGWDAEAHRRLVVTNWPRTALWLMRSGVVGWVVYLAIVSS